MIADTMGSTETDSSSELRKMYFEPRSGIYAVCAGNMEVAGEIVAQIIERLPKIETRNHGTFRKLLTEVVYGHRSERFRLDVSLPRYELIVGKVDPSLHSELVGDFRNYYTGAEIIIGSFHDNGMAMLYHLGSVEGTAGLVHPILFPGYVAIGAGSYNANFWLGYRRQRMSLNIDQSLLHAFEATMMASRAPSVNENTDICVVTKDQQHLFTNDIKPSRACPYSLELLRQQAEMYGPRSTEDLGFPKPSTPQTSGGQQ